MSEHAKALADWTSLLLSAAARRERAIAEIAFDIGRNSIGPGPSDELITHILTSADARCSPQCSGCGDIIMPGTSNAEECRLTHDGWRCGTCVYPGTRHARSRSTKAGGAGR